MSTLLALGDLSPKEDDLAFLRSFYARLPRDKYRNDGLRLRSYRVAIAWNQDGAKGQVLLGGLWPLTPRPFFQNRAYDEEHGHVMRDFAPMEDGLIKDPTVQTAISRLLAVTVAHGTIAEIGLHAIRIIAGGEPSPEGKHQDQAQRILMLCVSRESVTGGVSSVYENEADEEPILRATLRPGQFLLLDDERLWHDATAVEASQPDEPGYRDMLVITARECSPVVQTLCGSRTKDWSSLFCF